MNKSLKKKQTEYAKKELKSKNIIISSTDIGDGSFGQVFPIIRPYCGRRDLCIKIFFDIRDKKEVEDEFNLGCRLYRMNNDFFTEFFELVLFEIPDPQFPQNKMLCGGIIQEKLENMDLSVKDADTVIKIMTDVNTCLYYAQQIFRGHLDIKFDNIMYKPKSGKFILIDWGQSFSFGEMMKTQAAVHGRGSFLCMAPEMLEEKYNAQLSVTADIYALGTTIRYIIRERKIDLDVPSNPSQEEIYQAKKDLKPLEYLPGYPDALIDIVNKCTAFDRNDRYRNAKELFKDLHKLVQSTSVMQKTADRKRLKNMKDKDPITDLTLIVIESSLNTRTYLKKITEIINSSLAESSKENSYGLMFTYSDRLYSLDSVIRPLSELPPKDLRAYGYCDLGKAVSSIITFCEDFEKVFNYRPHFNVVFIGKGCSLLPPLATKEQRESFRYSELKAYDELRHFSGSISGISFSGQGFKSIGIDAVEVTNINSFRKALSTVINTKVKRGQDNDRKFYTYRNSPC